MIQCIAIDDEPLALDVISNYCARIPEINLTKTFTSAVAAEAYLQENQVDLLLLDINMPEKSGLDFYKQIHPKSMVIFTTAYSQYAVEGFNVNAIDYLLKPVSFDRFSTAIEKAIQYSRNKPTQTAQKKDHIFIKADYMIHKIAFSDINYIEGRDNYVKIYLSKGNPIMARMSMKSILEELPTDRFLRIHRSYIVDTTKVTAAKSKYIMLNNTELPVGVNYIETVTQTLLR